MSIVLPLFRITAIAAFLAVMGSSSATAQAPTAEAGLSVQGRPAVYKHVVALRGKTFNESRVIVIATSQPLTARQFEQVQKANAEETQALESDPSYIKASFKEDGTLRYLVGDGGGAVFSKKNEASQTFLKGKATVSADRVKGEVTLNEPGDYAKVAKLVFDLPILTQAPAQ